MAHLAYRGSSGIQHFSGSKYVNPELGTHKFCIRTGTGINDVIKYGLTTQSDASSYCGLKFKISGMDVRIGKYADTLTASKNSSWTQGSRSTLLLTLTSTLKSYQTTKSGTASMGSSSVNPFKAGYYKTSLYSMSSTSKNQNKKVTVKLSNTSSFFSKTTFHQKEIYYKTTSMLYSNTKITCYATSVNQLISSFYDGDLEDNFNL